MKCFDPVLCYTEPDSGKRKFRNFSLANHVFKFYQHQTVFNCGKCLFCRKKRAYELACRCVLHSSLYKQNCFLTLTYDESKPEYHNNFHYKDIQDFKKRLRTHCTRHHNGKKIEVFNVHEFGKNGKKHWHLVVFNYSPHQEPDQKGQRDCQIYTRSNGVGLYVSKTLSRLWPYGFSTVGDVSTASAMYTAQYVEKDFKNGNVTNHKKSHSKHSGIGGPYFLKHYPQLLTLGYVPINGKKMPLPRYFQRLAHKHYSHYYEKENFFDTKQRKALYRPFKIGQENKEIADLFIQYKLIKEEKIKEYEIEWAKVIDQHHLTQEPPDFVKSGENALYDLRNKNSPEKF